MMVRLIVVLLALPACLLPSCSARWRAPAVPEGLTDQVLLLNNPAIRTASDYVSAPFIEEIASAIRAEVAYQRSLGYNGRLPTTNMLAISGGGSYGAYGAGILCGWTTRGNRPDFSIVTGISTGALTAPFAFAGPQYDAKLRRVYTTVTTSDLILFRGILTALTDDSAFDTGPLRRMIEELIDQKMMQDIAREYAKGRILLVGTCDLDASRAVVWNLGLIAKISCEGNPDALRLFHDVLMASAAIPGAFPPIMIDVVIDGKKFQEMHVDGGTKTQVFLYPPSFNLRAEAEARGVVRDRSAFIIRNAREVPTWESVPRRTTAVARRSIGALIHTHGLGDLFRIYLIAQRDKVDFNLAAIPDTFTYTSNDHFDPVFMTKLFDLGYAYASRPDGYPWDKFPPGWVSGATEPSPGQ